MNVYSTDQRSQFQPMTAYNKLGNMTDSHPVLPGTQLGISLLIRMPTQPLQPSSYADDEAPQPSSYLDDEPPLPEISIGVLDVAIPNETAREEDVKWGSQEEKSFHKESREVQHLEYR